MHLSEAKHVLQSFGFPVLLRLQLEAIPATNGCRYPVLYLSLWPHLCPFQSVYPQEGTQSLRLRGFLINPADVELADNSLNEFKREKGKRKTDLSTHRGRLRGSRKYFWANSSIVLGGSATESSPLSAERALTGGPCRIGAVSKTHRHPHLDPPVRADLPAGQVSGPFEPHSPLAKTPLSQAPPSRPVPCMGLAASTAGPTSAVSSLRLTSLRRPTSRAAAAEATAAATAAARPRPGSAGSCKKSGAAAGCTSSEGKRPTRPWTAPNLQPRDK